MSGSTDSNGCQPPLPGQPPPIRDGNDQTNNENAKKQKEICRDFIWGTCTKGTQCKFRHELNFNVMKNTLKFCHDFQNSSGCARERCTYLHASKEEESLFETKGQLPLVLAQRHANMSAASAETISQIALYIKESLAGPPPPPPPLPTPVGAPPTIPVTAAVPPPTAQMFPPRPPIVAVSSMVTRTATMLPIQQPPPPPPPPTLSTTTTRQQAPVFSAPPPSIPSHSAAKPPLPDITLFDASKPPPPIPAHLQPKPGPSKRPSINDENATPKKVKKGEEDKSGDTLCEQCMKRDQRVDALRKQMDILYAEEEYETLMYKKKQEEYQQRKEILKSLVSTDLYRFVEETIEETPQQQIHNLLGQLNQKQSLSGVSTVPKQFLLQLMDYVMSDSRDCESGSSSSLRFDESLLQALSALPRKANPVKIIYHTHNTNNTNNTNTPEVLLQTFADLLKQLNPSDRTPPTESASDDNRNTNTSNTTTNGQNFSNGQNYSNNQNYSTGQSYSNGQNDISFISSTSRVAPPPYGAPAPSFSAPAAPPPSAAPPPYQPYQPPMPPPPSVYYPSPYNGNPVVTESQVFKVPLAPAPPPHPVAPPAPVAPPPIQPVHYAMGRFPPPYYPRPQ